MRQVSFLLLAILILLSCSGSPTEKKKTPGRPLPKRQPLEVLKMPDIKVNLKNRSGIVLMDIALAYENKSDKFASELTARAFQLKDIFITEIKEKSHQDMLEEKTMDTIKSNLMKIFNKILLYGIITDIYIYNYNLIKID
ncbi:MAG: hypothetical protein CVV50_04425 [Spirochaetae bacterium HGW-Spirochaetae-6]|nr:MAG: hypothetical protein CVV50_04425 [Spirochaetae bacterium HGW-Spirochaetae-6]